MAEIYLKFNQYDKAVKVIRFLIDPFYIQYKLYDNKYMNLGCIEERNRNYETVTYDYNFGSNRKVIDDFINQLKTNN